MLKIFSKVALLGILIAFLSIILEQVVAIFSQLYHSEEIVLSYYSSLTWFLFASVLIEEGTKYAGIRYVIYRKFKLTGVKFVTASIIMGFFFGIMEIAVVIFSDPQQESHLAIFSKDIIISLASVILVQTLTSFLMGTIILFGIKEKKAFSPTALVFPIAIHILYNILIIEKGNYTNILIGCLFVLTITIIATIFAFNRRSLTHS